MPAIIRAKRSMLYATFYAKFHDTREADVLTTTPTPLATDPFNLNHIGDGYDAWTRAETQLLALIVVLVMLTLLFAVLVALDCGRNSPILLRSGTLRDIVRHGDGRPRRRQTTPRTRDNLKAPPLSYLAPPPYVDRRQESTLPI